MNNQKNFAAVAHKFWAILGFSVMLGATAVTSPAQVINPCLSITTTGTPLTEDFNTLASTGTSSSVPAGFGFFETGGNANTTYAAGTGSDTGGNTYSFGTTGSTERALGGLTSGSLASIFGACFTNNTGITIDEFTVSYTGEQWRLGAAGRVDRLDFSYSTNASSLTTGTYTDFNTLDFTAPVTTGTVGALNGNLAANRTVLTGTATSLGIANGSSFYIRWQDADAAGADDGLAVDDFSLTVQDTVTAANATVGGRVTTADGTPLKGARLILTDETGAQRLATSNAFGYYSFSEVQAGQSYVVSAASKRYQFQQPTQFVSVNGNVDDVNFVAAE